MRLTPLAPADQPTLERWLTTPGAVFNTVERPCLERPLAVFLIRLADDTPVGWAELFNIDHENGKGEIGIVIPEQRGRGLGVRAMRQLLRFAFSGLGLHRITARILASNTQALRGMRVLGFTSEGVERQGCWRGDAYEDVYTFGLLAHEFNRKGE